MTGAAGIDAAVPPSPSSAQPVSVSGYVRPPAKDVPGIIRAPHDEDDSAEPIRPPAEPIFSTEGMIRAAETRRRRPAMPFLWLGGAIGALVILAVVASSTGTLPSPVNFGGGGGNVAAASGSPGEAIEGASVAAGWGEGAGIEMSPAAGGSSLASYPPGHTPQPSGGTSLSPAPSGSGSPGTSPGPTDTPTAPPTYAPTDPPTAPPTPVATPTPAITPSPLFVRFEPDGSTSGGYTSVSTVTQGSHFYLFLDTYQGANCRLTAAPGNHPAINRAKAPATLPSFIIEWGSDGKNFWPAGTYTVTAPCTLSGAQKTATKTVTILPAG